MIIIWPLPPAHRRFLFSTPARRYFLLSKKKHVYYNHLYMCIVNVYMYDVCLYESIFFAYDRHLFVTFIVPSASFSLAELIVSHFRSYRTIKNGI